MKGDNVCDEVLNTSQCQFDGGDCDGNWLLSHF